MQQVLTSWNPKGLTAPATAELSMSSGVRLKKPLSEIHEDEILFYDIETDSQFAPYANLKTCAVQYGFEGKPHVITTDAGWRKFRRAMANPDMIKVDFNGVNYDTLVLARHGFEIDRTNHHDIFLMLKTVNPDLPAFSLKFSSFYFFRDPHFPEMKLDRWCRENNTEMWQAPAPLLFKYNVHDVIQTERLFRMLWDVVTRREHWAAYQNDIQMGPVLQEMVLEGGATLSLEQVWVKLQQLQRGIDQGAKKIHQLTDGKIQNPFSAPQLAKFFSEEQNIELELTDSGNLSVKKSVIVELRTQGNPVADEIFKIREARASVNYLNAFLAAADDDTFLEYREANWIPASFSISKARTRRTLSDSKFKINFQNTSKAAKAVQIVPDGWVGWWIDLTQIENIVHIYESRDEARKREYIADPNWNEYVWLCNQILGKNYSKTDLDGDSKTGKKGIMSSVIPHWTVYKQYKTGKLGMNFGMGNAKFCKLFGLDEDQGRQTFEDIHQACPAIRELVKRVHYDLTHTGYVTDVFGKRYSGPPRMAYKVVAYLIQGCGTGSLPKAQMRANWITLRKFDRFLKGKAGLMCGTTHDEISGRIRLELGQERILQLLQELMFNMTDLFSHKFDIPLRAKLSLSRTNAADAEELDLDRDQKRILELIK